MTDEPTNVCAPDKAPRRTARAAAKARTYQKVLEAAADLFGKPGGYEAATIRSIAAAAGMSTGAVFASFEDKAAMYRAVYGHPPITPEQGRKFRSLLLDVLEHGVGNAFSQAAEAYLDDHGLLPNPETGL